LAVAATVLAVQILCLTAPVQGTNVTSSNSTNTTNVSMSTNVLSTPAPSGNGTGVSAPGGGDSSVPCGQAQHACTTASTVAILAEAAEPNKNNSGARAEPENTDLGPCVCDLTWKACDANCQCDAAVEGGDCSETELALFTDEYGVGFKRENKPSEVPMCFSADTFAKLNTPMRLENSPLCVAKNNNPATGRFFQGAAPSVNNDKVRVEFKGAAHGPSQKAAGAPVTQPTTGSYKVGMSIPVGYGSYAKEEVSQFSRAEFLTLPYPGAGGRCQLGNTVKYWQAAEARACVEGGAVEHVCQPGSPLAADTFVKDLWVAKVLPGTQLQDWTATTKWSKVTVEAQVVERTEAGDVLQVYNTADKAVPAPSYDAAAGVCYNVLESLHLTLTMDGSGGIASVAALARLSHVPTVPSRTGSGGARDVWLTQSYSAKFVDKARGAEDDVFGIAAPAPATSPLADADARKSGSPGYLDGLPVRAGLVTNTTDADGNAKMVMRVLRQGLTLPSMALPSGLCKVCATGAAADKWGCPEAATADQGFQDPDRTPVAFNQDISVGCESERVPREGGEGRGRRGGERKVRREGSLGAPRRELGRT